MNILFDIAHPADVHMYRHVRSKLIEHGHTVVFMARDKDVVIELLDAYNIPYEKGTKAASGIFRLSIELIKWFFIAFRTIRRHNIDVTVSLSSPATAWAALLQGVPHLMFNDTETGIAQLRMARPATKWIYTPECLLSDWGSKQIRYRGIHDLAYLRRPASTLNNSELENSKSPSSFPPRQQPYAIIRFVSWSASHDRGKRKTTVEFQKKICGIISDKMDIYISAEGDLPEELEKYRSTIPPHLLHEAIASAKLVVGDGATTATEAAVLGVPSVYISPFADALGYCRLLNSYGLLVSVKDEAEGLAAIEKLLRNPDFKKRRNQREKLLDDTIDLVKFMTEKIEECGPVK
jgi:predicted glycosyltransferase